MARLLAFFAGKSYNDSMEEIITLQHTVSYQQEEISRLSEELYQQQKEIRELQNVLKILKGRVDEINENLPDVAGKEPPPPHY